MWQGRRALPFGLAGESCGGALGRGGARVGGPIFLGGSPDAAGGFHRCSPFLGALPCLPLALHAGEATPAGRRPSMLALGHPCKRRPSALRSSSSVTDPLKPSHPPRLAAGVVPSTSTRSHLLRSRRRQEPQRTPVTPRKLPPGFRDPLRRFSLGEAPMLRGAPSLPTVPLHSRLSSPCWRSHPCRPKASPAGRRPSMPRRPSSRRTPPCTPPPRRLAAGVVPSTSTRSHFPWSGRPGAGGGCLVLWQAQTESKRVS